MTRQAVFHLACAAAAALLAACGDSGPPPPEPSVCHSPGNTPVAQEPPPRPATPAELAIFAPVAPGQKLRDFDVREVRAHRGNLEVVCEKGSGRVVLSVALLAKDGPTPPASTKQYAVFYSARGAAQEDAERLATALADALEAAAAPPPPGLGPFVPATHTL